MGEMYLNLNKNTPNFAIRQEGKNCDEKCDYWNDERFIGTIVINHVSGKWAWECVSDL
jgi:hypothetical protein